MGGHGNLSELWEGPDQMPSCDNCLDGDHRACLDLLETFPYGLHACGCTNNTHEENQ